MTTDDPLSADESFDRDSFRTELAELIDHSREANADIEGAYDVRSPRPGDTDYTIEITEIVKTH